MMLRSFRGGLRSRLVLLVLLALLPVVAASTIANLRQRSLALEGFVEDARQTTVAITADLDRIVVNTKELLALLGDVPVAQGEACRSVFAGLLKVHPFLTNIGQVDGQGQVVCSAGPAANGATADWFQRAVSERAFVIGESREQRGSPQRELVFASPILAGGEVQGVLFATFNLAWIDRLLAASSVTNGAVGTVFDRDGMILYTSDQAARFVGTRATPDRLRRIRESGLAGTDTGGPDGIERRYVVSDWGTDVRNTMTLTIGYPIAAALRPFNSMLAMQSLFMAIGLLVALLAVNRAAKGLVLGPVGELVAANARLRAGDFSTRVTPAGGAELMELTASFNETAQSLEHTHHLEEQLRHAQRLQSIGQLAGGVAHEFNNMLTVILGHTENLLESDAGNDELRAIRQAAERSRELTHQLLAFSRQQLLQPKRCSLNALVRSTVGSLGKVLGPKIIVDWRLAAEEPTVMVDRAQFEHVLLNVMLNAQAAMPDGGSVTIETRLATVYNGSVEGLSDGPYAQLRVRDTGTGMSADTLARALEPFFTTKPFGHGSGLGLSTAYGIIRQSGGELTLDSTEGAGTTVTIYLPLAA